MSTAQSAHRLLICGTRSLAADVADLASEIPGVEVCGFIENMERDRCAEPFEGLPVHWVDDAARFAESHVVVCALGTTHRKKFTDQIEALGMRCTTLAHPTSRLSSRSSLGEGTILSVGVIIAAHTHLGRHVFVNRGAMIGHHTHVGDHASIMTGANVAGNCTIGQGTYIGMSAVIIDNLKIGAHSVVGAGAVVTKDVPDNVQVIGVPARIVKENIAGK